jgi:membrane protein DedA with SNARE-associated domain
MSLSEYGVMFVLVAIMGAGIPGPGDASLIAAGALAGEGKLNIWIVLATAGVAWMLGSVIGFVIGARGGRPLLDHPGRLEKRRRRLLAKGDRAFARYTFVASATLPAFVSGIFRVRFWLFLLGALTAGIYWIGIYVGVSYFLGEEIAKLVGKIGTKALIGVIVLVVAGLLIRAVVSKWRGARQARLAGHQAELLRLVSTGSSRAMSPAGAFGLSAPARGTQRAPFPHRHAARSFNTLGIITP